MEIVTGVLGKNIATSAIEKIVFAIEGSVQVFAEVDTSSVIQVHCSVHNLHIFRKLKNAYESNRLCMVN